MSTVALTRAKPEKKPSNKGRPVKYRHNEFRDRRKLLRLGFPGKLEEAVNQEMASIIAIARRYYLTKDTGSLTLDELIHFGEIGAAKAYVRFRYNQGWKFTTYANWWIMGEIERNIELENRSMVSIGANEIYLNYKKAYKAYIAGEEPDSLDKYGRYIYKRLEKGELTPEKATEWLEQRKIDISNATDLVYLDQAINEDNNKSRTRLEMVVSRYEDVNETSVDYELMMGRIRLHAYSLIDSGEVFKSESSRAKARVVFEQRCFKGDDEKKPTFKEIAKWFSVSKQCIEQIQGKLMENLLPLLHSDPVISEAKSAYLDC